MGMFDYVNFTCKCYHCGKEVDGFQTKAGPCSLIKLEVEDLGLHSIFYSSCECGEWLSFKVLKDIRGTRYVEIDE